MLAFGNSPAITLGTTLIVDALPTSKAASGGAIAETSTELGFAVGVAVLGSLASVAYRTALQLPRGTTADVRARATDSLSGALTTGDPDVITAAQQAYMDGVHTAGWAGAFVALLIAALALAFLRGVPRQRGQSTH